MIPVYFLFIQKQNLYYNLQNALEINNRVQDITVYKMMAIIPFVFVIDFILLMFVPIYLYIIYRDKLAYENKTITNLV